MISDQDGSAFDQIWAFSCWPSQSTPHRHIAVSLSVLIATGIYVAFQRGSYTGIALNPNILSILGVALALFLGFRANSSFARWSEASQAWSTIETTARTLARITITFVDAKAALPSYKKEAAESFKRDMVLRLVAFVQALRLHLRGPLWVVDHPSEDAHVQGSSETSVPVSSPVDVTPVPMLNAEPTVVSGPARSTADPSFLERCISAYKKDETDSAAVRRALTPLLQPDELDAVMSQPNKPMYLLFLHGRRVRRCSPCRTVLLSCGLPQLPSLHSFESQIYDGMASGILAGFDSFQMEGHLATLSAMQAACERIKIVPVPQVSQQHVNH
jgi:hypothetical protein